MPLPSSMLASMDELLPEKTEFSLATISSSARSTGFDCDVVILECKTDTVSWTDSKTGSNKSVPKMAATVIIHGNPAQSIDIHSNAFFIDNGTRIEVDVLKHHKETVKTKPVLTEAEKKMGVKKPLEEKVLTVKEVTSTRILGRGSIFKISIFGKAGHRVVDEKPVPYQTGDILRITGITMKEDPWTSPKTGQSFNYVNINGADVASYKGNIYELENEANDVFTTVHQYVDISSFAMPIPFFRPVDEIDIAAEARRIRHEKLTKDNDEESKQAHLPDPNNDLKPLIQDSNPITSGVAPETVVDDSSGMLPPPGVTADQLVPLYSVNNNSRSAGGPPQRRMDPSWDDFNQVGDRAFSMEAQSWKRQNADIWLCNQSTNGFISTFRESQKYYPIFHHSKMMTSSDNESLFVFNPVKEAESSGKEIPKGEKAISKCRFKYGQVWLQTFCANIPLNEWNDLAEKKKKGRKIPDHIQLGSVPGEICVTEKVDISITDTVKSLFYNLGIITDKLQKSLFPVLFPKMPVLTRNWIASGETAKLNYGKNPNSSNMNLVLLGTMTKDKEDTHCFLLPDYAAGIVSAGYKLDREGVIDLFTALQTKKPTEYNINMNSGKITNNSNRYGNPIHKIKTLPIINVMESTIDLNDKDYDYHKFYDFYLVSDWAEKNWSEDTSTPLKLLLEKWQQEGTYERNVSKVFLKIFETGKAPDEYAKVFVPIREDIKILTFCIFALKKTMLKARGFENYYGNDVYSDVICQTQAHLERYMAEQAEKAKEEVAQIELANAESKQPPLPNLTDGLTAVASKNDAVPQKEKQQLQEKIIDTEMEESPKESVKEKGHDSLVEDEERKRKLPNLGIPTESDDDDDDQSIPPKSLNASKINPPPSIDENSHDSEDVPHKPSKAKSSAKKTGSQGTTSVKKHKK